MATVLVLALGGVSSAQTTGLGQIVTNTASMTYNNDDGGRTTVITNTVEFTVVARPTASTIDFFRYSPTSSVATPTQINGSDYSPSGSTAGPFAPIGRASHAGGAPIDLSSPIPVTPADIYATGELMLVRVIDAGQNGNPNLIETVSIVIRVSTGDYVTLRLYESGPDTGEFWGYVQSTRDQTPGDDTRLTTGEEAQLTATYIDAFDATEISVDTALIDPYCRVFNSLTGELINNAIVTLIDSATGEPATVFGVDGVSLYPASITTGSSATDESGFVYELREGEFRYPLIPAGEYTIEVVTPEGLTFSSVYSPEQIDNILDEPFALDDTGSYGDAFTFAMPGPIHFDVPLDPKTDIVLVKTANPTIGDIGDFIQYSVSIENTGPVSAPTRIHDTAPQGFRYVRGSSRLGAIKLTDPQVDSNGRELTYLLPPLGPGGTQELSYVMQIGADVDLGDHINSAVVLDADDVQTSNIARASVTIREDLFRSTSTIIGRVAEYACDGDEEWSREIIDGTGVEGVRLYMETGAYTVTDADGLYHFEGVRTGTHVVQVDEETLPKGYTAMTCEENSQYAKRKISKFVDNKGGGIWRANFYLQRTGDIDDGEREADFSDLTEFKLFGGDWLNEQDASIAWVYPQETTTPSSHSMNIGIKHGPEQKVILSLNGDAVPMMNFQARDSNDNRSVMMSRWRSVDIRDGQNVLIAEVKNADGSIAQTLRREIHFVKDIVRAIAAPDQSILVADGRTTPVIALRIEDESGRPVHTGRKLTVDVQSPYRLESSDRLSNTNELVAPLSARASAAVGNDGIALIRLEPTLQTGNATITVTLDDGRQIDISMYLKPEKRDWIIVGLAEGSVGLETVRDKGIDLTDTKDTITDGRVAFFAKGMIKGDWLMTLAIDTDKRRGDRDGDLFDQIDPNAYYSLYGDRTYQDHEAQSRYPVYLKLEKNIFYAMFGDYNTDLTEGKLTRYSRRLSGFKTEYSGEKLHVIGFAAETNQGFAKDELAANGTSGPYKTSYAPVLANSEIIEIETRDRFRSDIVLERKTLVRHQDYTIDYLTGEIIFRLPVNVTDALFNPNVIVVDYETSRDSERNVTFGGRVKATLASGRVEIGGNYIHEEGNADSPDESSDLVGVDFLARITENTELRAEYAVTRKDAPSGKVDSKAYLAEIIHASERLAAEAYIREEEEGFGLGQQGTKTNSIRRIGAGASYILSETIEGDSGVRSMRNIDGKAYHEENLQTGSTRLLTEVNIAQEGQKFAASAGLRQVKDEIAGGESRTSMLAIAAARMSMPEHGLTTTLAHEQPIGGEDESSSFPQRTTLGVDKTLTTKATVSVYHEILKGADTKGQNTTVGVSYVPWTGTDVTAQSDLLTSDGSRRLGATLGVDQQFKISENWSAAAGLSQRTILDKTGQSIDIAPDAAISPVEASEDYTSAYVGLGYRTAVTSASGRIEARTSAESDSYIGTLGVARELSEKLSIAGAVRAQTLQKDASAISNGNDETRADIRIGTAWRPRGEGLVVLDRFDVKYDKNALGIETRKVVNNLAVNAMVGDRTQVTGYWGLKTVETDIGDDSYSSTTNLLGGEMRYDITERIDIGVHGQLITSGGTQSYSYGPSIGFSPADNTWISVGYNVDGYDDDDFEAAEYSQEGAYIKLRLKFDQDTARKLLQKISPTGR